MTLLASKISPLNAPLSGDFGFSFNAYDIHLSTGSHRLYLAGTNYPICFYAWIDLRDYSWSTSSSITRYNPYGLNTPIVQSKEDKIKALLIEWVKGLDPQFVLQEVNKSKEQDIRIAERQIGDLENQVKDLHRKIEEQRLRIQRLRGEINGV